MAFALTSLADHLIASRMPCVIDGDADRPIHGVATLEDAGPKEISFLSNKRYVKSLETTRAGAILVAQDQRVPEGLTVLRVPDPYAAVMMLIVHIHGYRKHPGSGISPGAVIDGSAKIGENANIRHGATIEAGVVIGRNVVIYPGCYVASGCRIGDDCVLHPNVVLYDDTVLGNRVTIHAGSIIGEDGLGYAPVGRKWHKIPQAGTVEIADDVEIGANCAIDRATLGKTVIGPGTKFSNLIAIGHGTKIGADCMFVAQVGLAGSVTVGDHVTMAGKVGVAGHLSIGDNAQLAAMSGVMRDVPADTKVMGAPAAEMREMSKCFALMMKLPEMREQIRRLEAELASLKNGQGS